MPPPLPIRGHPALSRPHIAASVASRSRPLTTGGSGNQAAPSRRSLDSKAPGVGRSILPVLQASSATQTALTSPPPQQQQEQEQEQYEQQHSHQEEEECSCSELGGSTAGEDDGSVYSCGVASSSGATSQKDHNSVTIKSDTSVKDAAGAIVKVLNRLASTFVTALQLDDSHEAANRAVKALAVSRKYIKDGASGHELGFYPLNRTNLHGVEDPNLFAFLAFKLLSDGIELKDHDQTDLNVSTTSDPNKIANAIICIIKERGQAIMKAGGGNALHVAMSAVINARRRLKRNNGCDLMLVPQWITEDTRSLLGRESKFLRMNILRSGLHGLSKGTSSSPAALMPV